MKLDKKSLFLLATSFLLFSVFLPQIIDADLTYSFKFGSFGSDDDEFDEPTGIETDDNIIYVADKDNNRILVLEDDGDYDFQFGTFCDMSIGGSECNQSAPKADEDGDGQFNEPVDVTVDSSGNIYVVDSQNDRVQKFQDDGDFEIKFGSSDSGDTEYLGVPSGITIHDSEREVYVSSAASDSILVFDKDSGGFVLEFGSSGSGDGRFSNPSHMVIDDSKDYLYVADTDNDRIQIFELVTGTTCPSDTTEIEDGICFVEEFGSTGSTNGKFRSPTGLALDTADDLLYVADTDNDRIQIFELVDGTTCPSGTSEIVEGICFVEEFGSTGSTNGKFNSPMGIAIDASNDKLLVTDTNNDRIQVLDSAVSTGEKPGQPTNLDASAASKTSIVLTWKAPVLDEGVAAVTGYKIDYHEDSESFSTLIENTAHPNTSYLHEGLDDSKTYTYRVYAINSEGTSSASSQSTSQPKVTTVPSGLIATAISPNQIFLSWIPPSETFGQTITGYKIEREITTGLFEIVAEPGASITTYTLSNLQTDKTYTYVVSATFSQGTASARSNTASATPTESSEPLSQFSAPNAPAGLTATAISPIQIDLSWNSPTDNGGTPITGYKIEVSVSGGSYATLVPDSDSTVRTYSHTGRDTGITYTYKVSAHNAAGTSGVSNVASATPTLTSGQSTTNERPGPPRSLAATAISTTQINLSWSAPSDDGGSSITGYKIDVKEGTQDYKTLSSNVGKTTSYSHTGLTPDTNYQYRMFAINSIGSSTLSATVSALSLSPEPEIRVPDFVEVDKGAQYYLDRYNNEAAYKAWFDSNFPDYTIQEAIELAIPDAFSEGEEKPILPFVDPSQDPQYYVDRYNNEASYKAWFDSNFPDYTIEEAVGLGSEEEPEEEDIGLCGPGTTWIDGYCIADKTGGGCLIATATYGSELSVEVQQLRELRDNTLLETESGSAFMNGFNSFYYSFSPTIADWERQNPVFKEAVHLAITPLITSLSILNYVDMDSEAEVLGYGIGLIILNIGMYVLAPVGIGLVLVKKKL